MKRKRSEKATADTMSRPVDGEVPAKDSGTQAIAAGPNTHSSFLALPLEIRREIYSLILSNHEIHIKLAKAPPYEHRQRRVSRPHRAFRETTHDLFGKELIAAYKASTHRGSVFEGTGKLQTSLLLVCSQVYAEAHLLLYTSNRFTILVSCLPHFLYPRAPQQLQSLRDLRLCADSYNFRYGQFRDNMRTAAQQLTCLRDLKIMMQLGDNLAIQTKVNAVFLQGVAAWIGNRLENVTVKLIGQYTRRDSTMLLWAWVTCKLSAGNPNMVITTGTFS